MWRSLVLIILSLYTSGCNRQDAERLGRIGAKMSAHAKSSSGELGAKMEWSWPKKEPTLQEKIQDRLRFDKTLGDAKLEVNVKDKEVELKGIVKEATHKLRAIELAESVASVEKVIDAMSVQNPDEPSKKAE